MRQITKIDVLAELPEGIEPKIYVESDGKFRRASPELVKDMMALDCFATCDGMVCMVFEKDGGSDE